MAAGAVRPPTGQTHAHRAITTLQATASRPVEATPSTHPNCMACVPRPNSRTAGAHCRHLSGQRYGPPTHTEALPHACWTRQLCDNAAPLLILSAAASHPEADMAAIAVQLHTTARRTQRHHLTVIAHAAPHHWEPLGSPWHGPQPTGAYLWTRRRRQAVEAHSTQPGIGSAALTSRACRQAAIYEEASIL